MKKVILSLLVILHACVAFSQEQYTRKVIKYSLKDGLSLGFINWIVQDDNGFMWFATGDGLNRFDGTSFKVFRFEEGNPYSLPNNHVQVVFKDKQGDIYVSCQLGVYRFDISRERFTKFDPGKNKVDFINDVNSISSAGKYILWFTRNSKGFFSYNKKTQYLKNYDKTNLPGLSNGLFTATFEDSHSLLWIGGQDSVIAVHHVKNGIIIKGADTKIPLGLIPKGRVNAIYEDHNSNVWIATSNGLALYRRDQNTIAVFEGLKYNLQSNYFFSLLEDRDNHLFIGLQDGGLYYLDLNESVKSDLRDLKFYSVRSEDKYNITERTIQSLYLDRDKNVWAGTFGDGIYMLSNMPDKFLKFQYKWTNAYGTSPLRYYGICMDDEGNLWMGSDGDGIFKTKLNGEIIRHYYADGKKGSLTNNAILSAYMDREKDLWFGSYAGGLFKYEKKTDRFINYRHNANDSKSLCSNDVRAIFEDSAGNLWIGTNRGGISVLKKGSSGFVNYTTANSTILSNNITTFCEDKGGKLLIGTYSSGLIYFDKDKNRFFNYFRKEQSDKFLPGKVVNSLKFIADDDLLIGTEGDGLVIYNTGNKTFRRCTERNGLANNTIKAIQPDYKGNIWVSTNKGLSRITERSGNITNYDASDGLQTGNFNDNSVIYSPKDKFMCFGGTEGYNIFYPEKVRESTFNPAVVITGLQVFGNEADKGDKDSVLRENLNGTPQIVLRPDQSVFQIQYAALNYANAEKSEFAYQLLGLDKDWSYVHNQKSATYRYLEPGDYVFKVKATNQDGIWFNDFASVNIRVLPPWYKTWWAYLSYLLAGLIAVYYRLRYKSNQQRLQYEIRLAQMSAEKEKELNEKKISFFTNISHEFRTPLTLILNPVKELLAGQMTASEADLNNLHVVHRNARHLLSLVDHLLLFRKADSGADKLRVVKLDLVALSKEVCLCFNHLAESKGIKFQFICTSENVEIYVDKEKVEIILFNLLSNAMKFTPVYGTVSVAITEDDGFANLQVKDTGCGIPPGIGEQLFDRFFQAGNSGNSQGGFGIGLYLVKTFVGYHKGTITYESNGAGKGTAFNITLLKGKEHLGTSFIFEDICETSVFLEELMDCDGSDAESTANICPVPVSNPGELLETRKTMLVIDDNVQIRQYIRQIFQQEFEVFEANNGAGGLEIAGKIKPSIVISDVMMTGLSGIEVCRLIKEDSTLNHIPVILLTASILPEMKLQGIEGGADDYITKPFEKEVLVARVNGLVKNRDQLHKYFYSEITLQSNNLKIPADYKEFLKKCIKIVEAHLQDSDFCIKNLADEIGMSHSNLYKKIKFISAGSANEFIRFIRLRQAAKFLLDTDCTVAEAAYKVGINDTKYFREQFSKLFGLNPSEYIKKFRKSFRDDLNTMAKIKR